MKLIVVSVLEVSVNVRTLSRYTISYWSHYFGTQCHTVVCFSFSYFMNLARIYCQYYLFKEAVWFFSMFRKIYLRIDNLSLSTRAKLKGHVINTVDDSTIFNTMLKRKEPTYILIEVFCAWTNLLVRKISKKLFSGECFK